VNTETVHELVALLKANDGDVRIRAAQELGLIALGMTEEGAEAVAALIDALKDPDAEVRGSAASALGGS
jgi:HEAT repeat protein